jgi:ferredoxin-NADP reductase
VGGPLLLVAGGPGICLLMAMITHRAARASQVPTRLLYSSRSLEEVIYGQELDRLAGRGDGLEVFHTLTRSRPSDWKGYARRIDRDMLAEVSFPADQHPLCMVCGPTPLVEAVASTLVELGNSPGRVKTERFDPPEDRDDGQHSATTGRQRGSGYVARGFRSGDDIRARRVRLVRNDSADRQAAPVHASAIAGRSATLQHVR